uniref:helix-turn-helix domain-containing protein n=1 Tax=Candidatus Thiodubiliella endoseptemdiera TaxID=2738886 RepID=UPI0034DE7A46
MQLNKLKIKELMAKKGISTQSELAHMLGISKNQLSNILSERFDPIKSNVNELAQFFEVNPLKIIKKGEKDAK